MKKTYIIPETLTVQLNPRTSILTAGSPGVTLNNGTKPEDFVDAGSVETKGVSDVNVWDNEW